MTDLGARAIAEALKFLGNCLISAAFVHKSPAHYQEIMEFIIKNEGKQS